MISPHSGLSRRGWLPALFVSLLFHGGLVLPCLMLPSPGYWSKGASRIDTLVPGQRMEVGILIYGPELPRPTIAKRAPQAQQTVTPPKPIQIPAPQISPATGSDSAVVTLRPGETEEQESSAETSLPGGSQGNGTGSGSGMTTSFFEIPTQAQAIVYVIDRSASMGPSGGLAAAKRELLASLSRLPVTARFQVIAYNRSAEPLPFGSEANLALASPENKQRAAHLLEALEAEGGTAHVPALRRALALQPDVIYFLTDADGLTAEHVRTVTALNRGRSIIHAIQLAIPQRSADPRPVQFLAWENHGVYRSVAGSP